MTENEKQILLQMVKAISLLNNSIAHLSTEIPNGDAKTRFNNELEGSSKAIHAALDLLESESNKTIN